MDGGSKGFRHRKGTPKNLCNKEFLAELSGELSGAICLKTLVLLASASNRSDNSLVLFVRFFGFGVLFWSLRVSKREEVFPALSNTHRHEMFLFFSGLLPKTRLSPRPIFYRMRFKCSECDDRLAKLDFRTSKCWNRWGKKQRETPNAIVA